MALLLHPLAADQAAWEVCHQARLVRPGVADSVPEVHSVDQGVGQWACPAWAGLHFLVVVPLVACSVARPAGRLAAEVFVDAGARRAPGRKEARMKACLRERLEWKVSRQQRLARPLPEHRASEAAKLFQELRKEQSPELQALRREQQVSEDAERERQEPEQPRVLQPLR
jgi:hypothetical protein